LLLASCPASSLNQKNRRAGIPYFDSARSKYALAGC